MLVIRYDFEACMINKTFFLFPASKTLIQFRQRQSKNHLFKYFKMINNMEDIDKFKLEKLQNHKV